MGIQRALMKIGASNLERWRCVVEAQDRSAVWGFHRTGSEGSHGN